MISCPLCCQSQFSSIDLLQTKLINAMHGPFMCPICNEIQHGLDNLAAHLSKHIQIVASKSNDHIETNPSDVNNVIRSNSIIATNKHNNANQTIFCELQESQIESFTAPVVQCVDNNNLVEYEHVTEKVISSSPVLLLEDQKSILSSNAEIETAPSQIQSNNNNNNNDIIQVFFCHLCACTFRSLELQQMHLQLVHELNVNQIESKVNEARNIQRTSDTIDSNSIHCNLCTKRFKMIGSLRLHVRMVHGVSHVPQKLRNPQNKQHSDNVAMNTNLVQTLSGQSSSCATNSTADSIIMVTSLANNDAGQLQLTLNSPNYQMEHSENDNNNNYGVASNSFGKDDNRLDGDNSCNENNINKEPNGQNDDRTHECDICNKRFTTKYFLKKHKRIHTGETPYMCELCNRTFTFQQSYHRHLSYHSNDRPHICSDCGRAFKESSTLYNHQRIHSGEKPFECETCGKCFRQRVSYLVHRRIHTGVMPYNCNTCDTRFRYKISLRTHKCTGKKETESMAPINNNNNNNELTFIANDQDTQPSSEQISHEFITESHDSENHPIYPFPLYTEILYSCENTENGNQINQSSTTANNCDSFNLNDLLFYDGETAAHTDLANVTPSMNEIFPQTMDILNALYEQV